MKSLTEEKRYDLIYAFNSTSRYLDDLLNIDNIHSEHMVHRIDSDFVGVTTLHSPPQFLILPPLCTSICWGHNVS